MRNRRGNAAVKVALSMSVLLGVASISIDLGWARVVQQQLDMAAQAGSHAGAAQLNGTAEGMTAAVTMTQAVAAMHEAAGAPVVLDVGDIELGVYDDATNTFTVSTDETVVNAVRARASRPTLAMFFAPAAFKTSTIAVAAQATAVHPFGGAGEVNCFLPLAVPQCLIEQHLASGEGIFDVTLNPQTPSSDQMGWARPYYGDGANAAWTRDQLRNCTQDGSAGIGSDVSIQNGQVTSALSEIQSILTESGDPWNGENLGSQPAQDPESSIPGSSYGRVLDGPIFVFDGGPEYCVGSGGSYNGLEKISGFVWLTLYDIDNSGSADSRWVRGRIDTVNQYDYGTEGGGGDYGVVSDEPPRFVMPQ